MNRDTDQPRDEERPELENEEPAAEESPEAPGTEAAEAPTVEELEDRLLRLRAEFENFRKRTARDRATWTARALERFLLDLLPAVDSFDRALAAADESEGEGGLLDGMKLVHKQLLDALERHGVEPIDAVGQPFDPSLHEAFMSRPAGEGETPGTIVEEFSKGYVMGDRVVRPTKGVVAAAPEEPAGDETPEEE